MERVATAWEPRSGQCIEASEQRIAIICTVFRGLSGSSACHAVSMKNWLSRFRMGSNDADAQRAHNPQEAPRQMATAPSKNCILEVQEAHVFPSGVFVSPGVCPVPSEQLEILEHTALARNCSLVMREND